MSNKTGYIQNELTVEGSSIQSLAYQIHVGYGGDELDNWLEAEETLKNTKSLFREQVTTA